jgi:hypothetical protein
MQAKKHFLRDFLGQPAIVQKMVGETEHHPLVLAHQTVKIAACLFRARHPRHCVSEEYLTMLFTSTCWKSTLVWEIEIVRL